MKTTSLIRLLTVTVVFPALHSPLVSAAASVDAEMRPVILIRSGWQTSNIGDIAHMPGLLSLLETYAPKAKLLVSKAQKTRRAPTLRVSDEEKGCRVT